MPLPAEINKRRRGHNFYPPKKVRDEIPGEGGTRGESDPTVYIHYFGIPAIDVYVTELDPETGYAHGYTIMNDPQNAEWGDIYLPELEEIVYGPGYVIERDCWFDPTPASQIDKIEHR